MNLQQFLGNLFGGLFNDFLGNGSGTSFVPNISSITETRERNNQQNVTGTWDNVNSSFILIVLTIIGALALNNGCYGREKKVWIDDCILNQIIFIILISLLFNVESRVIPSSISASGTAGTANSESDIFIQTPSSSTTSNASAASPAVIGEAAAIVTSEPLVVEVTG